MGGRSSRSGFASAGGSTSSHVMAEGRDISESFQPPENPDLPKWAKMLPTPEPYTKDGKEIYIIEDVIHQQGFDGLPQVLKGEEFDKAVKASGIIAQRGYGAESQETLDKYHDQLINGEFYVRAEGGYAFGRGMYCAMDFDGNLSGETQYEVSQYAARGTNRKFRKVETFTLVPNARIANFSEVNAEMIKDREMLKKFNNDVAAYAAAKGYDAMRCEDGAGAYTVVFNRSKMIIKGD